MSKRKVNKILFFSLSVLLLLGVYLGYDIRYNMQNEKELYLKENVENRWNLIENSIYENIDKANIQNDFIVFQLNNLIKDLEIDGYDIKSDLDSFLKNNSKIKEGIDGVLKEKYINKNNDNNDPFVMVVDMEKSDLYITNDNSVNCASLGLVRDVESELIGHYNEETGRIFFNNILNKSIPDVMFWNFLPNKLSYKYSKGTLEEIEKFFKSNLDFENLDDIEFLVPRFYKTFTDAVGRPYTQYGQLTDAKAIVIVSGFNIVDNIETKKELYNDLKKLENSSKNYIERYKKTLATKTLLNIMLYCMMIVLYLYQDKLDN